MLRYLIWRNIRVRYAQTVLGALWAILRPGFGALLFTGVFGELAQMPSDGAPYPLFAMSALVPWGYFSSATTAMGSSLVSHRRLLTKVYFARLVIPLSALLTALIDFAIALVVLVGALWGLGRPPPAMAWFAIPGFTALMMIATLGLGLWISAATVLYRDVGTLVSYGVQALLFASPVVYPTSLVPERYRFFYALNPMATVIEGFRAALLGASIPNVQMIMASCGTAFLLLLSGFVYFRRMEVSFADVV